MKVTLLLGSASDEEFSQKIVEELNKFDVESQIIVASAHKVPEKVLSVIHTLNEDPQPQVVICVVGMSNGLGGVTAGSCIHPVMNCPPYKTIEEYMVDFNSNVRMPSDVPVMTVLHPKNAALCAVRILAEGNNDLQDKMKQRIKSVKSKYS